MLDIGHTNVLKTTFVQDQSLVIRAFGTMYVRFHFASASDTWRNLEKVSVGGRRSGSFSMARTFGSPLATRGRRDLKHVHSSLGLRKGFSLSSFPDCLSQCSRCFLRLRRPARVRSRQSATILEFSPSTS
jgi:hypothetical protein